MLDTDPAASFRYTDNGTKRTTNIPVTTVLPPGTVVINHAVDKTGKRIATVAGSLGGSL